MVSSACVYNEFSDMLADELWTKPFRGDLWSVVNNYKFVNNYKSSFFVWCDIQNITNNGSPQLPIFLVLSNIYVLALNPSCCSAINLQKKCSRLLVVSLYSSCLQYQLWVLNSPCLRFIMLSRNFNCRFPHSNSLDHYYCSDFKPHWGFTFQIFCTMKLCLLSL